MKGILAIICLTVIFASCYNDKADKVYPSNTITTTCDTTNVTYSGTISIIMGKNCSVPGCHDASTQAGGYNFTTYNGVVQSIQNDVLVGSIEHASGYVAMPETGGSLSTCEISEIQSWINKGNPDN